MLIAINPYQYPFSILRALFVEVCFPGKWSPQMHQWCPFPRSCHFLPPNIHEAAWHIQHSTCIPTNQFAFLLLTISSIFNWTQTLFTLLHASHAVQRVEGIAIFRVADKKSRMKRKCHIVEAFSLTCHRHVIYIYIHMIWPNHTILMDHLAKAPWYEKKKILNHMIKEFLVFYYWELSRLAESNMILSNEKRSSS